MCSVLPHLGRIPGIHVEQSVDDGAHALENSTPAMGAPPLYLFGISVRQKKPRERDAVRTRFIISLESSK